MNVPDLSRESFLSWLESKPAEEVVVGRSVEGGRCASCPLATWLRETWSPRAVVNTARACSDYSFSRSTATLIDLPPWARAFIRATDLVTRGADTAADCLAILAEIPEDSPEGSPAVEAP